MLKLANIKQNIKKNNQNKVYIFFEFDIIFNASS